MSNPQTYTLILHEALELGRYIEQVTAPEYGAVATFFGNVRSPNLGKAVKYIDYEGYESMIVTQMEMVAQSLRAELDLGHFLIAHRLGRCSPGEASIALVASSKHRKEALLACQRGIDLAKDLLPIWKYEVTSDGATWIEGSSAASPTL